MRSHKAYQYGFRAWMSIPLSWEDMFPEGTIHPLISHLGGSLAYAFWNRNGHWLKAGVEAGQFALNDYRRGRREVGGLIEDRFPNYLQPYFEWEWGFASSVSFIIKSGYKISSSGNQRVTDVGYELYPTTGEQRYSSSDTEKQQRFYGSGFEWGIGLSITLN